MRYRLANGTWISGTPTALLTTEEQVTDGKVGHDRAIARVQPVNISSRYLPGAGNSFEDVLELSSNVSGTYQVIDTTVAMSGTVEAEE